MSPALVCVCLESRLAFPALVWRRARAHPAAWCPHSCGQGLGSLPRSDGRSPSLATNFLKIELLTLQKRHRAYAPRRSPLATIIPHPVLWVVQLAIKISILAFDPERLVAVVCIVLLCVHHFPNAGDRRVFANKWICIASFCPTTLGFLIRFDFGKLCKALLLAESFGSHAFIKGRQTAQTKQ
jgi:hypothetical protein